MGYRWSKAAEGSAQNAENIPAGQHKVKITKIVFGKKDESGEVVKFESKNGDPQIMLILQDNEARELPMMITLSDKAAWVLAGILKAAGADLAKMEKAGIMPECFMDETFANAQLIGRVLSVEVKIKDNGHPDIKPLRPRTTAPATEPEAADIPF